MNSLLKSSFCFLLTLIAVNAQQNILSFPGAEGWGRHTSGGRGGRVIYVTNTNNSGTGSLRDALTQSGKRIIIVKVAGRIALTSDLFIDHNNSDFTLVGQKAPGEGLLVSGRPFSNGDNNAGRPPASNFIIAYMRFVDGRGGSIGSIDSVTFGNDATGATNGIFYRCSIGWGNDEQLSIRFGKRITVQECLIHEGFANTFLPIPPTLPFTFHNYGGILENEISSIRNLYIHCSERSPMVRGHGRDVRNNIIYNCGVAWTFSLASGQSSPHNANIVGNYVRYGAARTNLPTGLGAGTLVYTGSGSSGEYFTGNILEGYASQTADNSLMDVGTVSYASTPYSMAYVTPMTALEASTYVTNVVGAWKPARSSIDERLLLEYKNITYQAGTWYGWLTNLNSIGGYPTMSSLGQSPYTDSDNDGMEDSWEIQYFQNLNVLGEHDFDGDGWTNLEEFLWDTDPKVRNVTTFDLITNEPAPGQGQTNPVVTPFSGSRALIGKGKVQGPYQFKPLNQ